MSDDLSSTLPESPSMTCDQSRLKSPSGYFVPERGSATVRSILVSHGCVFCSQSVDPTPIRHLLSHTRCPSFTRHSDSFLLCFQSPRPVSLLNLIIIENNLGMIHRREIYFEREIRLGRSLRHYSWYTLRKIAQTSQHDLCSLVRCLTSIVGKLFIHTSWVVRNPLRQ